MKYCDVRMNVMYIYYWHCDDVNTRSIRTLSDGSIGKQFSKKKKKKDIFLRNANVSLFSKIWNYFALHVGGKINQSLDVSSRY